MTRSGDAGGIRRRLLRRGLVPGPRLLRALARLAESLPTRGNQIEIFHDGDLLYRRMLDDIREAKIRIHIEMYMFLPDRSGWRFAHALAARQKQGVRVRVVYDAVGSFGSGRIFQHLAAAGVELIEYHPVAPWRRRFALFRRNHRKNVIVDGRIGYTGGMNIGDYWAGRRRGGRAWRDTQARVQGPAAGDLEHLFVETWHEQSGELLDLERTVLRESGSVSPKPAAIEPQVYVVGGRGRSRRAIRRMYLVSLGHARRSVTVTCSYFAPERKLRRALQKARERGVRVRLLLPRASDVLVSQLASQALFGSLLRAGIEIYLWRPTVLHAKTVVVDGQWSIVGSSNWDNLSFRRNLETNLVIIDPVTGADLERSFERDIRFAEPLVLEEWNQRPTRIRLLEWLAYWFRVFV